MPGSLLTVGTGVLRERFYERTESGASLGFCNPFIETTSCRALPFWAWCISHFHHFIYNGTDDIYDGLLSLTMPVSFQSLTRLWLGVSDFSCPSINRFHCLPAARAESMTLLRGDRAGRCSEIRSIHLIDLVSMTVQSFLIEALSSLLDNPQ